MPDATRTLRALVVAIWIFILLGLIASATFDSLPNELSAYAESQVDSQSAAADIAALAYLVAWIVVCIAVFRLASWARGWYVAVFVVGSCLPPFLGPSLYGAWEEMFYFAATAAEGAVAVMLYFSEASIHFERADPFTPGGPEPIP